MPSSLAAAEDGAGVPRPVGRTFSDPELQRRFDRDGYVVVRVLDHDAVDAVRTVWAETHPVPGDGFHSDVITRTPEAAQLIEDEIGPVWDGLIDELLVDHRRFVVSFLTKWPGDDSQLDMHQDWTYADERFDRTASFWIALDDASAELGNGPLHVIPGSHHLVDAYRGPAVEDWYRALRSELAAHLVPVDVRAGDAVIMDNAVLHESPPNRTDQPRRAIAAAVAPRRARFVFAAPEGDHDEVMLVDLGHDYLTGYDPDDPSVSGHRSLGTVPRLVSVDHGKLERLVGTLPDDLAAAPGGSTPHQPTRAGRLLEGNHTVLAAEHRRARAAGSAGAPAALLPAWVAGGGGAIHPLTDGIGATRSAVRAHPVALDVTAAIPGLVRAWVADVAGGATWSYRPLDPGHQLTAVVLDAPGPAGSVQIRADGAALGIGAGRSATGRSITVRNQGAASASIFVIETVAARRRPLESLAARRASRPLLQHADEILAAVNPNTDRHLSGEGAPR